MKKKEFDKSILLLDDKFLRNMMSNKRFFQRFKLMENLTAVGSGKFQYFTIFVKLLNTQFSYHCSM
jgi:hypothetical protein